MNGFGDGFWIGFASAWLGVCLIELFARWWKRLIIKRMRSPEGFKPSQDNK